MTPRYVTKDGVLFEVLEVKMTRRAGPGGLGRPNEVATYILQDVRATVYDEPIAVNQTQFEDYRPVDPVQADVEAEAAKLRAELERWAKEAPWWAKT